MKKLLPILLAALMMLPAACVKDDLDACSGYLHVYFSYIYGGTNEFFSTVNTNVHLGFYHGQGEDKYRELEIERTSIGIDAPWLHQKTPEDQHDLTLISWTHDDRLEYHTDEHTLPGESYIRLKEITAGSGICSPVKDLLYGRLEFDALDRVYRNDVTLPYLRAVCRVRVTMIPKTIQGEGGLDDTRTISGDPADSRSGITTRDASFIPQKPDDYIFHILGTRDRIDYNNITGGERIILSPDVFYDETTGNVRTDWFGAFSSLGEYLKVNIYVKNEQVAAFDCAPLEMASVPGNYIDLIIDGRYLRPLMEIRINGWRVALVESEM